MKVLPSNVVEAPIEIFPPMLIFEAAVKLTDVPAFNELVRLPATVSAVPGMVLTAAPDEADNVKFPYVCAETV